MQVRPCWSSFLVRLLPSACCHAKYLKPKMPNIEQGGSNCRSKPALNSSKFDIPGSIFCGSYSYLHAVTAEPFRASPPEAAVNLRM